MRATILHNTVPHSLESIVVACTVASWNSFSMQNLLLLQLYIYISLTSNASKHRLSWAELWRTPPVFSLVWLLTATLRLSFIDKRQESIPISAAAAAASAADKTGTRQDCGHPLCCLAGAAWGVSSVACNINGICHNMGYKCWIRASLTAAASCSIQSWEMGHCTCKIMPARVLHQHPAGVA